MTHPVTSTLAGVPTVALGDGLAVFLAGRQLAEQGADHLQVVRGAAGWMRASAWPDAGRAGAISVADVARAVAAAEILILGDEACAPDPWLDDLCAPDRPAPPVELRLPSFPGGQDSGAGEGEIGAAIGLFTDVDLVRGFLDLGPTYSGLPYASAYAAVHAVLAATLALRAARRDGRARRVEVPLAAAGMSAMAASVLRAPGQPPRYDVPRLPRSARTLLDVLRGLLRRAPRAVGRIAESLARGLVPPLMDAHRCRDGRLLYLFAVDHDRAPRALLGALDLLAPLEEAGLHDDDAYAPHVLGGNLRESANLSPRWRRRIRRALGRRLAERDAEAWERELTEAGATCAVVRPFDEFLGRPELDEAGVVVRAVGSDGASRLFPGPHVWVARGPPAPAAPESPDPRTGAGLLGGVTVLDLSTMVAGPVAARTLGEYGAEVLKVGAPHPHHGPRLTCWYGLDVDRGKRSALIDLGGDAGREALRRLLARADVVVHNFTSDAAARLGLAPDAVAAARPDAVICRIGAFRGPRPGPWAERRGYDPVLQAASGVMARYGAPGRPAHHGVASCIDYLTGFSAAWAAALALLDRDADPTPRLRLAETALAQSALLIQAPFATWPATGAAEPCGPDAAGPHALERLYRARDDWVWLYAPPERLHAVVAALGAVLPENASVHDPSAATALARAAGRRTKDEIAVALVGVARVRPVRSIDSRRADWLSALRPGDPVTGGGFAQIVRAEHPGLGPVDTLAPGHARCESDPLRVPQPARKPGADTRAVLAEIGFADAEITRMLRDGAAADALAPDWLPP